MNIQNAKTADYYRSASCAYTCVANRVTRLQDRLSEDIGVGDQSLSCNFINISPGQWIRTCYIVVTRLIFMCTKFCLDGRQQNDDILITAILDVAILELLKIII